LIARLNVFETALRPCAARPTPAPGAPTRTSIRFAPTEKFTAWFGDDHGVEVRLQPLQAFVEHGDQVGTNGVHLGVKLAANHAVAEIDKACTGIAFDFAACILERLEDDDAFGLFDFFRCGAANIENGGRSLFLIRRIPCGR